MSIPLVLALALAAPPKYPLSPEAAERNKEAMRHHDAREWAPAMDAFHAAYRAMPDARHALAGREQLLGSMRATLLAWHEQTREVAPLCRLRDILTEHVAALTAAFPDDPDKLELRSARARHIDVSHQLATYRPGVCDAAAAPPPALSAPPAPSAPPSRTRASAPPLLTNTPAPPLLTTASAPAPLASPASAPAPLLAPTTPAPSTSPTSQPTPATTPSSEPPLAASPVDRRPSTPGRSAQIAGAVLLPLGLAALGALGGVATKYRRNLDEADDLHAALLQQPCTEADRARMQDLLTATRRQEGVMISLGIVGGALITTGVALLVRGGLQRRRARLGLDLRPGLSLLSLTGEF